MLGCLAAIDALLFGDVLEAFELPRFQLLLPRIPTGRRCELTENRLESLCDEKGSLQYRINLT